MKKIEMRFSRKSSDYESISATNQKEGGNSQLCNTMLTKKTRCVIIFFTKL